MSAPAKLGPPGTSWSEATRYPGIRKRFTRAQDGAVSFSYTARAYDPLCTDNKKWLGSFATEAAARATKRAHEDVVARRDAAAAVDDDETVGEFYATWPQRFPRPKQSTMDLYVERAGKFADDHRARLMSSIRRKEARTWAIANKSRVPYVRVMFSD